MHLFVSDGRNAWIRPDGSGTLCRANEERPFLLEYDCGTLDAGDYRGKLTGYVRHFESAEWRERFPTEPLLLFVCSDDRAEKRVRAAVIANGAAHLPILLATDWLKPKDIPDMANFLKYDVKQAKDLLTAAGFKDGFKTSIAWTPQYATTVGYTASLERYAGDLKQAGIEATPVSYEYGVWIKDIYRGEYKFDGLLWGPGRSYADPDPYVAYWLHPKGIANQSRVNDPAMTALIEKQATQVNVKERWETLREIQRLEAKNMYYIWRNTGTTAVFVHKNVHDFARHEAYDSREYWSAWVDA